MARLLHELQWAVRRDRAKDVFQIVLILIDGLATGNVEMRAVRYRCNLVHKSCIRASSKADCDDREIAVSTYLRLAQCVLPRRCGTAWQIGNSIGHQNNHLERVGSGAILQLQASRPNAGTNVGHRIVVASLTMTRNRLDLLEVLGKRQLQQSSVVGGCVDRKTQLVICFDCV